MPTQAASGRVRLGVLALFISTALLSVSYLVLGPVPESPEDLRAYAEFASSTRVAISNFLGAIGWLLAIFGFIALYAFMASGRAERWAFFAMVLCVPGAAAAFAASVGTSGVEAVAAEQYLEGQRTVLEEWSDRFDWTSVFIIALRIVLFPIGGVLFGVAIWRSQSLPQGAAILWLASLLFEYAYGLFAFVIPTNSLTVNITSYITSLLLIAASGWILWSVWRQPSSEVVGGAAQARVR